ncbi:MAG: L-lysine-epsilon aminotransferase, partial [Mycobacterium sp.]
MTAVLPSTRTLTDYPLPPDRVHQVLGGSILADGLDLVLDLDR